MLSDIKGFIKIEKEFFEENRKREYLFENLIEKIFKQIVYFKGEKISRTYLCAQI